MIQKTIRFYEDCEEDMRALSKLEEYKNYGFSSARHMMIAAINVFLQKGDDILKTNNIDIDYLADEIVKRININTASIVENSMEYTETQHNYDNLKKAMDFIDTL